MSIFRTEICDLFGIEHPIILGGMAWAGEANLVAAVSEAGGLGLIGSGNMPEENLREEIKRVRALTDKPFGVNIVPIAGVSMEGRLNTIIGEGISIVAAAFSDPTAPFITELHKHDVRVLAVVPNVRLARRVQDEGADVVVASGTEAGGHCSHVATLPLVPQVVDAVNVPVVACGGIGDARGFLAALSMGACGIQMGTRFLAAEESICHPRFKEALIKTSEQGTVITGNITGTTCRVIKNKLTEEWLKKEDEGVTSKEEYEALGLGKIRDALIDGDIEYGSVVGGQITGIIKEIEPVKKIINDIIEGAKKKHKDMGLKYLTG